MNEKNLNTNSCTKLLLLNLINFYNFILQKSILTIIYYYNQDFVKGQFLKEKFLFYKESLLCRITFITKL